MGRKPKSKTIIEAADVGGGGGEGDGVANASIDGTIVGVEKKEDKDSAKYKILLKFINKLLTHNGKEEIDDLIKFVDIDRELIVESKQCLDEMQHEIYPLFDKTACGFYRRSANVVINCFRGMVREIGYSPTYVTGERYETINGKAYRRSRAFYSIK